MSVIIGNQIFQSPQAVRPKLEQAAAKVAQTQAMADYVEIMADGYLALDNTPTDENRKKNQVTFLEDGLYVHAERSKTGALQTFEMIDERDGESRTIKKTTENNRASYEISMGGQTVTIAEDANGTLVFELQG